MRRGLLVALLVLGMCAGLLAVESGEVTMTIVRAEEKTRDRIVYWVNDTPLYQPDIYFEVAVRAGDKLIEAEYQPGSAVEALPVAWKPGARVKGRVRGHSLYLKRPNGIETRFVILKRSTLPPEKP